MQAFHANGKSQLTTNLSIDLTIFKTSEIEAACKVGHTTSRPKSQLQVFGLIIVQHPIIRFAKVLLFNS